MHADDLRALAHHLIREGYCGSEPDAYLAAISIAVALRLRTGADAHSPAHLLPTRSDPPDAEAPP